MLALELGVVGLMNVQFAVKGGEVYILEVNPRASRTVPFVSKATGRPLAKIAAMLMVGKTLDELGVDDPRRPVRLGERERLPFAKFPGATHPRAGDAVDRRGDGDRRDVRGAFGKACWRAASSWDAARASARAGSSSA